MATARASTGQMPVVSPPLPVSKQMTGSSVGPLQQTGQFDPAPAGVPDPNPSADSCQAPPRGASARSRDQAFNQNNTPIISTKHMTE